jgi:hypothetical protein
MQYQCRYPDRRKYRLGVNQSADFNRLLCRFGRGCKPHRVSPPVLQDGIVRNSRVLKLQLFRTAKSHGELLALLD